jgi:bacterial/archaeal transporter family protein
MNWILWSLLSAFFAGATAILAKIGVKDIDSNLATAIRTTVVLIFTWVLALATAEHGAIRSIPTKGWIFLFLSGLATGLSWLCYFRALQMGPASGVAPIDKLSVVFVILFAAMFLGEGLTPSKVLGGLLITTGAVILALG